MSVTDVTLQERDLVVAVTLDLDQTEQNERAEAPANTIL